MSSARAVRRNDQAMEQEYLLSLMAVPDGVESCTSDNAPRRRRADHTREHTALVNAACARLGSKLDLRVAKMSPGGERTKSGKPARCGPPGLGDICGVCIVRVILRGHVQIIGRLLMLEAKTGNARQSRVQIAMMRTVRGLGGFYSVFRTVDEAEAAYERCRMGLAA